MKTKNEYLVGDTVASILDLLKEVNGLNGKIWDGLHNIYGDNADAIMEPFGRDIVSIQDRLHSLLRGEINDSLSTAEPGLVTTL